MILKSCPKCKKTLRNDIRLCPNCGYIISDNSQPVNDYQDKVQSIKENNTYEPKRISGAFKGRKIIVGIIGVVIIWTLILALYSLIVDSFANIDEESNESVLVNNELKLNKDEITKILDGYILDKQLHNLVISKIIVEDRYGQDVYHLYLYNQNFGNFTYDAKNEIFQDILNRINPEGLDEKIIIKIFVSENEFFTIQNDKVVYAEISETSERKLTEKEKEKYKQDEGSYVEYKYIYSFSDGTLATAFDTVFSLESFGEGTTIISIYGITENDYDPYVDDEDLNWIKLY